MGDKSYRLDRLAPIAVFGLLSVGCGEAGLDSVEPTEVNPSAAIATAEAPTTPGIGHITIRVTGTSAKSGNGALYSGDCDDMRPQDDDLEVMTFSAPWKNVGAGGSGGGGRYGSPVTRLLEFEKSEDIPRKTLRLSLDLEQTDHTVAQLVASLPKIADVQFGDRQVGLYYVEETNELRMGYVAFFPLARTEGLPQEAEFTGRYVAEVGFQPVGPLHFQGWSVDEIIALYSSFSTARCFGEGLAAGLAPLFPELVYE